MVNQAEMERVKEHFAKVVEEQLARVERLKNEPDWFDYQAAPHITVGVCGGDGIGPFITGEAVRVLKYILAPEISSGKIEFRVIEGLTIENRAAKMKALPDEVVRMCCRTRTASPVMKGPMPSPPQTPMITCGVAW